MQTTPQTEFNDEQNRLIASLAVKMRSVGMFIAILGVVLAVHAVLTGIKISNTAEVDSQDKVARLLKWLPAVVSGICAVIFMAIGAWTRTSGASFQKIVSSHNRDVWHLGNALSSLYSMFSLLNALVVIGLIVMIASIALQFMPGKS